MEQLSIFRRQVNVAVDVDLQSMIKFGSFDSLQEELLGSLVGVAFEAFVSTIAIVL